MLTRVTKTLKWCFIIAVSACVLLFTSGNYEAVNVTLFPLPYEMEIPKFLLVLICFTLGVLVGGMLLSLKSLKWRRLARTRQTRIDALENELKSIKEERNASTLATSS